MAYFEKMPEINHYINKNSSGKSHFNRWRRCGWSLVTKMATRVRCGIKLQYFYFFPKEYAVNVLDLYLTFQHAYTFSNQINYGFVLMHSFEV